jgi:hypothetical protein
MGSKKYRANGSMETSRLRLKSFDLRMVQNVRKPNDKPLKNMDALNPLWEGIVVGVFS